MTEMIAVAAIAEARVDAPVSWNPGIKWCDVSKLPKT